MKEARAKRRAESQGWTEREGRSVVRQSSGMARTRAQVRYMGILERGRRACGGWWDWRRDRDMDGDGR